MRSGRCALAVALAEWPGATVAHPVHEIVQNANLTLAPGAVIVRLDLTAGPQVAASLVGQIDADRDGRISQPEARAYATGVPLASRLAINGQAVGLHLMSVGLPPTPSILAVHGTITATRRIRMGVATLVCHNDLPRAGATPTSSSSSRSACVSASPHRRTAATVDRLPCDTKHHAYEKRNLVRGPAPTFRPGA